MTRRPWIRRAAGLVTGLVLALAVAAESDAQGPVRKSRRAELDIGALWTGGASYGSIDANETAPTGGVQPLFSASSRIGAAAGIEADLAFRLVRGLRAELSGTWSRANFRTTLTGDFEGAAPATAVLGVSLFSAEGSAVWYVRRRGKWQPFVRGGLGWLRELTSDHTLSGDGRVANIGGGMKYWWRECDRGFLKRFGLRCDVRLNIRSGGVAFGTKTAVRSPALTTGLMIGF